MSRPVLSQHQTEAAAAAAPAEAEGGRHDEAKDGADEREDERRHERWRWWRSREGQHQQQQCGHHSSVHPAAGQSRPGEAWDECPAYPGSDGCREEGRTSKFPPVRFSNVASPILGPGGSRETVSANAPGRAPWSHDEGSEPTTQRQPNAEHGPAGHGPQHGSSATAATAATTTAATAATSAAATTTNAWEPAVGG